MRWSRRSITRLIVSAPVAAAAGLVPAGSALGLRPALAADAQSPKPEATPVAPEETPLGRFLSKQEDDLSAEERRHVRKQVASLEQGLAEVRAFVLANDVPPSGSFRAMRSPRARRGR